MKKAISAFVTAAIVSVGVSAGTWLWNEVLREKASNLKDHFNKKSEEDEEL